MNTGHYCCEYYAIVALQAGARKGSEADEGVREHAPGIGPGCIRQAGCLQNAPEIQPALYCRARCSACIDFVYRADRDPAVFYLN
ncbi:hypothetical protein D3C76_196920 [compost metagenome]